MCLYGIHNWRAHPRRRPYACQRHAHAPIGEEPINKLCADVCIEYNRAPPCSHSQHRMPCPINCASAKITNIVGVSNDGRRDRPSYSFGPYAHTPARGNPKMWAFWGSNERSHAEIKMNSSKCISGVRSLCACVYACVCVCVPVGGFT